MTPRRVHFILELKKQNKKHTILTHTNLSFDVTLTGAVGLHVSGTVHDCLCL